LFHARVKKHLIEHLAQPKYHKEGEEPVIVSIVLGDRYSYTYCATDQSCSEAAVDAMSNFDQSIRSSLSEEN